MTVLEEIAEERKRQIEAAGCAPENDDGHASWPLSRTGWAPNRHRRDLVIAAAGLVLEIERLDRAAAHKETAS